MSRGGENRTPVAHVDYVTRVLDGLHPSEKAKFDALLAGAAGRHGLQSEFDRDHPIIGVLAEMTLHGTKMAGILSEMNALAARCEDTVRQNKQILARFDAHASLFLDRMKEAEQSALEKVYEPYNTFKQGEMQRFLETHRRGSEELDKRRSALSRNIAQERKLMEEEIGERLAKAEQREIAAHKRMLSTNYLILNPLGWVIVGIIIAWSLGKVFG
jgi:uncharacterized membrane-anchored protein